MCGADGICAYLCVHACVRALMRMRACVCTRAHVNARATFHDIHLLACGFVCTRGRRRVYVKSLSVQSLGVNDVFD